MATKYAKVLFLITREHYEKIRKLAYEKRMSMSATVRDILDKYLKEKK